MTCRKPHTRKGRHAMRIAIIIPARLRSTRLPDKLLLAETGRPLIVHTVERALEARAMRPDLFGDVVVAADDDRIIAAVHEWRDKLDLPVRAVMTSPDHQSGSDRIAQAAAGLPDEFDAVLNLQGDEPEIEAEAVVGLAEFFGGAKMDIATLVYPIADPADRANPTLVKMVMGAGGRALYFSRTDIPHRREETLPEPSFGHVGIYLYRRAALERFVSLPEGRLERIEKLEQLRALENGMIICAKILDRRPAKGIDVREDYEAFAARSL